MSPDSLAPAYELPLPVIAISADQIVSVIFTLAFIIWVIFTLVTTYHWLRYGHRSSLAIPIIISHVVVSFFISLFAASGFIAS